MDTQRFREQRRLIWERQRSALVRLLRLLRDRNAFWAARLRDVQPDDLAEPGDLRRLPLLTKDELVEDQVANPPYGSALTYPRACYVRMHQTSGTTRAVPLRFLDTRESWARFIEMWLRIYEAFGVTDRDRIFLPFSFGPFIGFWGAFEAAQRLGAFVVTGGGMSSRARLDAIIEHEITVLPCTPTYGMHLAEKAAEHGIELTRCPVRLLIVAGEPGGSVASVRSKLQSAWGAQVRDHWGMTEVGALGFECPASPGRLHLFEEDCIAEVISVPDGQPAGPGEEGELVITTLWRAGHPVLRYRTGDMVRLAPAEPCSCGMPYIGLDGGILGRRDHMLFIRGNNVYPSAIEAIVRELPEIAEFEAVLSRRGALAELLLRIEPVPEAADRAAELSRQLQDAIRDRLHFRATIEAVPPGSLPRWELKARRWRFEDSG